MSESNAPTEGDRVPHDEYYAMAGGTIPFNLTVKKDGEWQIRCHKCDEYAKEDEFEWVDSAVYVESVGDNGTVLSHDVQSVTLICPNCNEEVVAR